MSLKIHLLGQFKILSNEVPVELPSRPAQSLLAYLALNAGVTQRREKLASLLWPEASESNARSYLRQALWRIRKSLESASLSSEDYLKVTDISVTLDDQSDYWLDSALILDSVEPGTVDELIEVISLYRGELLPGFYDEWIVLERDRLQAAYHQKMNLLLDRLLEHRYWDEVLTWAEDWIRLGYSPEPAFRALMRAHAGLGDQGMVQATYQRCEEALDRELGLKPSLETRRLYEGIRRGELDEPTLQPSHIPPPPYQRPSFLEEGEPHPIEKPIFVARERELAQLDDHLDHTSAGQGRVVFVTGESGSGKTALVHEFTRRAQEAKPDLLVASGNCNAHTGIGDPYLPFREVLGMLTGDVEARWIAGAISQEHARRLWKTLPTAAQALTDHGPTLIDTFVPGSALVERAEACAPGGAVWLTRLDELVKRQDLRWFQDKTTGPGIPNPQQSFLFDQYTRVLRAIAQKIALVLVLDDLQWADTGSIRLLFHLGRQLIGSRILIVGAYRSEEVALGRDGEQHPLEPVIHEFQRLFGNILVNVDQAESRDFLEAIVDSEPNRLGKAFREMLHRQTRGQPLFTIELLRGMQERGDLGQDQEGRWIEGQKLNWETMPARVEAVIAQRIGRLAQPLQATLQAASVEGDVFTAEVVARVNHTDERELLSRLSSELDRRHRLVRADSIQRVDSQLLSRYRFRHTLVQKYLYNSLDEVERVYLHELVGTTLEGLYGTEQDIPAIAVQLARHFQEARITEKAVHYLLQAGERAVLLSAYQEGISHLNTALDSLMTLPHSPKRDQQELDLLLALGIAWQGFKGGQVPEIKETYTRARELCQQMGKISEYSRVVDGLSVYYYVRAESLRAREYAEEALSLALQSKDPLLVVMANWILGVVSFSLGDYPAAHSHLNQAIDFYDPQKHHYPFVFLRGSDVGLGALAYDACCLWCLGYPDQALKRSQQSLALAKELDHPFTIADVLCFGGCMFNAIRRDAQALIENAKALEQLAIEKELVGWLGTGTRYRGEALTMQSQAQEGIARIRKGMAIMGSDGIRIFFPGTLGFLSEAQVELGDPESGLKTSDEAIALIEKTNERHWEAEVHRLRAQTFLALGNEAEAETSYQKAIEVAQGQSAKSWELRATVGLSRLWLKQDKPNQAREILEKIYDWFTEGFDTPDLIEAKILLEELS